jgi:Flp pilus assembly protein TadD
VDSSADEQELAMVTGFSADQVAAILDRLIELGVVEVHGGAVPGGAPKPPSARGITQTRLRSERPQVAAPVNDVRAKEDINALRRRTLARKLSSIQTSPVRPAPVAMGPQAAPNPAPARPAPTPPSRDVEPPPDRGRTRPRAPTPCIRPPSPYPGADTLQLDGAAVAVNAFYGQAFEEARFARVEHALEEGKAALGRRDYNAAINAYRLAASHCQDDAKMLALCNDAIRFAAGELAEGYWEQALEDEREGRWEDASLNYARVCQGRPDDAMVHDRAANAALRSSNVRRAVELARRAIELAPISAAYRITLARAYAAADLARSAQGELDRALALAPDDARIKNLVARVRAVCLKAEG